MQKRKFSKTLYDEYDEKAKTTLMSHLEARGHTISQSKEDYNVDIVSEKEGYTYFNEAEVKVSWKEDWPSNWADIRIPERKKRLVEKYGKENGVLNFYIFRKDMKQVFRIKDTCLTEDRLKPAFGPNIAPGEKFFHIPYGDADLLVV